MKPKGVISLIPSTNPTDSSLLQSNWYPWNTLFQSGSSCALLPIRWPSSAAPMSPYSIPLWPGSNSWGHTEPSIVSQSDPQFTWGSRGMAGTPLGPSGCTMQPTSLTRSHRCPEQPRTSCWPLLASKRILRPIPTSYLLSSWTAGEEVHLHLFVSCLLWGSWLFPELRRVQVGTS